MFRLFCSFIVVTSISFINIGLFPSNMPDYLARYEEDTPSICTLVNMAERLVEPGIPFVNYIGNLLTRQFWVESVDDFAIDRLKNDPQKNGVYFNGHNLEGFLELMARNKFPFWNEYSGNLNITDPEGLMQRWLDENGRDRFGGRRPPEEILQHQYIGEGGGCGDYVLVMADILRKAGYATKVVLTLKDHPYEPRDIERLVDDKPGNVGHYMGAVNIDGWRLFDFKWQWNPLFNDFYAGQEDGLTDLDHRNQDGTFYVPVTRDLVYHGESFDSDNVGMEFPNQIHDGREGLKRFALDYFKKL